MKNEIIINRLEEIVDEIPYESDYISKKIMEEGPLIPYEREIIKEKIREEYKENVEKDFERRLKKIREKFGNEPFRKYVKKELKKFNKFLSKYEANTDFLKKFDKIFAPFNIEKNIDENELINTLNNLEKYYYQTNQLTNIRGVTWYDGFGPMSGPMVCSKVQDMEEFFDNFKNISIELDSAIRNKTLDKISQETIKAYLHNKDYNAFKVGRGNDKAEILKDNLDQIKKKFPDYTIHTKQNCDFFNKTLLENLDAIQYHRGLSLIWYFDFERKFKKEGLKETQNKIEIDKNIRALYE